VSKLAKNSVAYFMDGAKTLSNVLSVQDRL